MVRLYVLLSLLFSFAALTLSEEFKYNGYQVLTIKVENEEQEKFLRDLEDPEYDFWRTAAPGFSAEVMVPPRLLKEIKEVLEAHNMKYNVTIPDVQKIFDKYEAQRRRATRSEDFFGDFHQMSAIYEYLNELSTNHQEIVKKYIIGSTCEGRQLTLLKIGKEQKTPKPAIWIDAGIHGREWVAPPAALYTATQLITKYGKDDSITEVVNNFDWYILPVANPDGYEYSRTKDKMWRKNRNPIVGSGGIIGVDLNRNFPYKWGQSKDAKANRMNSDVYAGRSPLSEPESNAMFHYLKKLNDTLSIYVSIHSHREALVYPWGYTRKAPEKFLEMHTLAEDVVDKIEEVTGELYNHGTASSIFGEVHGTSMDWVYGDLKVAYSFAFELREHNEHGFFIPEEQIKPISKEAWTGLLEMALYVNDELNDKKRTAERENRNRHRIDLSDRS